MKRTYAYVKYVAPKQNKHGSFDTGSATAICLGVTLNATERERYIYKQGEIDYPEDLYRVKEQGGRRELVTRDEAEEPQDLNALLAAKVISGRMYKSAVQTVEFTCLDDLTSGRPIPPEAGPEPPVCPHCRGRKTVTAFVDCADHSRSGLRQINCPDCKGEGTVTREYLERLAIGEAMRQDRLLRDVSLREESHRLGISPRELSDREHGRLRAEGEVTHIKRSR